MVDNDVVRLPAEFAGTQTVLDLVWLRDPHALLINIPIHCYAPAGRELAVARELATVGAIINMPGFTITPKSRLLSFRSVHILNEDQGIGGRDLDAITARALQMCQACVPGIRAVAAPNGPRAPHTSPPRIACGQRLVAPVVERRVRGLERCRIGGAEDIRRWLQGTGWRWAQDREQGVFRVWMDTAPGMFAHIRWDDEVGICEVEALFPAGMSRKGDSMALRLMHANALEAHPGFVWSADERWICYRLPVSAGRALRVSSFQIEQAIRITATVAAGHRALFGDAVSALNRDVTVDHELVRA